MQLPSRLRSTTIGDLLGALHRACASGTLELVEDRGRAHRIHLARGLVIAVELDGASASLCEILRSERTVGDDVLRRSLLRAIASRRLHGEVLVDEFRLSSDVISSALRRQTFARLAAIEELVDARVVFHVAVRHPRWALRSAPLEAREFLHGRRRARERRSIGARRRCGTIDGASTFHPGAQSDVDDVAKVPAVWTGAADGTAWRVLGILPGTDIVGIKRAYRHLARTFHPDLHPRASDEQRRALEARFVQITEAYRTLVA
jgi:hypothetical protein